MYSRHCHWHNIQVLWWSGVVVSASASINEVNLRLARLVLRWATVSGFNSRCRTLISVCNQQPPKANSAFHPSGVGKWVPALAGKAKAGMIHSVSGWTRGVLVKLWDPLITRAIPERLRNPRLPLPLPLPLSECNNALLANMTTVIRSSLQEHILRELGGPQLRPTFIRETGASPAIEPWVVDEWQAQCER